MNVTEMIKIMIFSEQIKLQCIVDSKYHCLYLCDYCSI